MPKPTTAPDALALVRKSGLVPTADLDRAVAALPADDPDPDRALAQLVESGLLTRFHAGHFAAGRWKGFTLGPYRLLDRLGAGGMGTVYLADHAPTGDRVAVKVLHPRLAADPTGLARFAREAATATALDHPHIVPVVDVVLDHRPPYLVMEYVDGMSLQAAVAAVGPLPPAAAAECGRQALLGLHHAHERGLVHRDVKPANLALDRRGVVRVLDLGVVRVDSADDPLTLTADGRGKLILGTADYLAPEQAIDSSAVDTRADVYALGATVYFLLTGHPPFADAAPSVKLLWKQTRDPQPVEEVRPDVPPGLAAAVGRMLARDPADRFPTPQAAADALAPFAGPAAGFADRLFARTPTPAPLDPPTAAGSSGHSTAPTDVVRVTPMDGSDLHPSLPPQTTPVPQHDSEPAIRCDTPPARASVFQTSLVAHRAGLSRRQTVTVLGVAMALGFGLAIIGARPPTPPPGPATVVVSRSGPVDSVRAALAVVEPGGRIEIRDPVWDEPLVAPVGVPADVTIVGATADGARVVWQAPLDLTAANGLTLENVEIDGQGRHPVGVRAGGRTVLREVLVRGVTAAGLEVVGRSAAVRVERCRFLAEQPTPVGVRIAPTGGQVEVIDCRFEGPFASAVQVDESVAVRLERNRTHGADAGVRVLAPAADGPLSLAVERCVFADGHAGLWFEIAPGDDCRLAVAGNLFDRVRGVAVVPGAPGGAAGGAADNLATDPAAESAVAAVGFVAHPVRVRKDPADDAGFLRHRDADLPPALRGRVGQPRP